jgi:hypothetical protein
MKLFWIIGAFFSFSIMTLTIVNGYDEYQVFTYGNIVEATVIRYNPPSQFPSKSKGYLKFKLNNNNIYTINRDGNFYSGEKIQLRYLEGYEDTFLFPNQNPDLYTDIICAIMFLSMGVACVYYVITKQV